MSRVPIASGERLRREIALAERRVPLVFKTNPRARRIVLRLDYRRAEIVVVLPRRVSTATGHRFALDNRDWLESRVGDFHVAIPFRDGADIPFLGETHRIRHRPDRRGTVWRESDEIHVAGAEAHLARRLLDWFRREAKTRIEARARAMAAKIGARPRRIAIRDTKSRWGSCTSVGDLAFSWRVIFAPEAIFDYVIAHEVSHLREMNHGPRFWALCAELAPQMEMAKTWLAENGTRLYRYGAAA